MVPWSPGPYLKVLPRDQGTPRPKPQNPKTPASAPKPPTANPPGAVLDPNPSPQPQTPLTVARTRPQTLPPISNPHLSRRTRPNFCPEIHNSSRKRKSEKVHQNWGALLLVESARKLFRQTPLPATHLRAMGPSCAAVALSCAAPPPFSNPAHNGSCGGQK